MLPIRLEMHNFLAYRAPDPINLEDLHLACLVGENGAGKSSLLDAITWALWGKARTRSDDDLIHLGQSEMQVSLDFVHDKQPYRVIRKRKMGARKQSGGRSAGQSTLDLFAYDPDRQAHTLISEPSMRETQAKINRMLRLDYDIFTNSAFLQQGQADAFTIKTPAQRKEILAEILQLDRWAHYEEAAKEKLRAIENQIQNFSQRIEDMEREIDSEPALFRELDDAREKLELAQSEADTAEQRLDEVKGADIELRNAQKNLTTIQNEQHQRQQDLQATLAEIERLQEKLALYQSVLAERDQIEAGVEKLEAARQANDALGDKLVMLRGVEDHLNELNNQLTAARNSIELEIGKLQTDISKDQQAVQSAENIAAELDTLDAKIADLEKIEAERDARYETINQLNAERAECETQNRHLKVEMDELKNRILLLEDVTEATCPVCGQPLNEEQRTTLLAETQAEGKQRGDLFRANAARMEEIVAQIDTHQTEMKGFSQQLKELPALRSRRGGLGQLVENAQEAQQQIDANQRQLDELERTLAEDAFGEAIRDQIASAEQERAQLAYDEDEHASIKTELETYRTYQQKANDLELALKMVPDLEDSLKNQHKQKTRYEKSLNQYEEQLTTQQDEIERLTVKVAEMNERQKELNLLRERLREADRRVVETQQKLKAIATMRQRREQFLEKVDTLKRDASIYEQLKTAFGKNGVPAMLIDAAIPELEEASNELLSRMTGNRMHLMFQTQREKKTGGMAETLDILIADELGTRDYDLYSGGEAFRVNFAIRVALSQMLARRAGAQLRTLFIDEGFGTQDNQGRERLVEAITTIQDDFDLILVITHIEELKDAFPARIEVHKTQNGSFASIR